MQPQKVWAVYFSGTGTTEKTVRRIASSLAAAFSAPLEAVDFTAPAVRKEALTFGPDDLVVLGTPTYAGRVPNVLLPYLTEQIRGAATPAVPVVLFGNRDFDDSLMELRNIMTANGFVPVAAAAFVGEHSFSRTLGAGRPNAADLAEMDDFARAAAQKIGGLAALPRRASSRGRAGAHPALLYAPRPPRRAHQHSEGQAQDRHGSLRRLRACAPPDVPWAASIPPMCRRSRGSVSSAAPVSKAVPLAPSILMMRDISTTSTNWKKFTPALPGMPCFITSSS